MSIKTFYRLSLLVAATALIVPASGCGWRCFGGTATKMLGADVDQYLEPQEHNAEAAKYIVYQHEFELNEYEDGREVGGYRLNYAGEDHVKQIAYDLRRGSPYQVVVERSRTSVKPGTKHEYPVHLNPELDMKRRLVVVRALTKMGIPNADEIVVVAPSFAQPFTSSEAERAYQRGLNQGSQGGFGGVGGIGAGGFGGFF
ncbi:MAG: hypothetical protein RIC55_26090 [Pirellulaceae bacterium]